MAQAKKTRSPKGQFAFQPPISDITFVPGQVEKQDRQLEQELFGKGGKLNAIIDSFEDKVGIKPAKAQVPPVFENRAKVFDFEDPADVELFRELMNAPQYAIRSVDKNWTVHGTLKLFVMYQVDKNFKPPKVEITDDE